MGYAERIPDDVDVLWLEIGLRKTDQPGKECDRTADPFMHKQGVKG
jgi:hypothetical protein